MSGLGLVSLVVFFIFIITLHAKVSGAVYCYRSCLWRAGAVCGWVCGSVTSITWNCMNRSSPNWVRSVGEGSDHLQRIKFWPSCAHGKGVSGGAKNFGSTLLPFVILCYYSQRAVFASLLAHFFHYSRSSVELDTDCHYPAVVKNAKCC